MAYTHTHTHRVPCKNKYKQILDLLRVQLAYDFFVKFVVGVTDSLTMFKTKVNRINTQVMHGAKGEQMEL